jgi:hypothetical protein
VQLILPGKLAKHAISHRCDSSFVILINILISFFLLVFTYKHDTPVQTNASPRWLMTANTDQGQPMKTNENRHDDRDGPNDVKHCLGPRYVFFFLYCFTTDIL